MESASPSSVVAPCFGRHHRGLFYVLIFVLARGEFAESAPSSPGEMIHDAESFMALDREILRQIRRFSLPLDFRAASSARSRATKE